MTKKDYELIANAVRLSRTINIHIVQSIAVDTVVNFLADALEQGNPHFDRVKFLKACKS